MQAQTVPTLLDRTSAALHASELPIRKLRFETLLHEDESIPGAIAKAVSDHVLWRMSLAFDGAGVTCSRPGLAQLLPPEQLARLAATLQCDPQALIALAGTRVYSSSRQVHQRVEFGDLTVLRANLDFNRRRIAPTSLRQAPYHRVAWLNLLLPYCPYSLERMVDHCGHCSAPLGWQRTWGLGVCEECELEVPSSNEPPLSLELVGDYRLFASLMSPVSSERAAARASLPKRLHSVTYASLIRLACRIGLICRDDPINSCRQFSLDTLPPETLASVVSVGAGMLKDWPISFHRFVHTRADSLRNDASQFVEWRVLLRRLACEKSQPQEQTDLILEVIPDLRANIERSFASGQTYYLNNEAMAKIGISHQRLSKAMAMGVFDIKEIPGKDRRRVQLAATRVDEVATLVRSSQAINTIPTSMGLPLYAVEQLVGTGLLVWECDPAILAIRDYVCIKPSSVEELLAQLRSVYRDDAAPADAVALRTAARRIGGREKPWAAIMSAIVKGELPIWADRSNSSAESMFVRPGDMKRFDDLSFERGASPFPFSPLISQDDTAELLNLPPKVTVQALSDFALEARKVSRALCVDKNAVLAAAQKLASPAEIGAHLGVPGKKVASAMRKLEVPRVSLGWDRLRLVALGVLPAASASGDMRRDIL